MRTLWVLSVVILAIATVAFAHDFRPKSVDLAPLKKEFGITKDGTYCTVCVLALTLAQQQMEKGEQKVVDALAYACDALGNPFNSICKRLVTTVGVEILDKLLKRIHPDAVCSFVGVCKECHLQPETYQGMKISDASYQNQIKARVMSSILAFQLGLGDDIESDKPHKPMYPTVDLDGDHFASMHPMPRGADWRGRDCNDLSSKIHPGVYDDPSGTIDSNCNGISGIDRTSGKGYEKMLCEGTGERSLAIFGDSASAGFHIPIAWLDLKNLTNVLEALIDEIDYPGYAWGSGWASDINDQSIYAKLRAQNRCNHRDYQNMAKNGAVMKSLAEYQIDSWSSSGQQKPVLSIIGYIGNDVCKRSLDEMTKPADFEKYLLDALTLLDSRLPPNSSVVILGLVDGRILYNTMHNLQHPFGVTYDQFYKFLTCVDMNPCKTWLTDDEQTRDLTTKRAMELDAIIERKVAEDAKRPAYKNFKLGYVNFSELVNEAFVVLEKEGRPISDLIDEVDGFHPSLHFGHRLIADAMWNHIIESYPGFVGGINPNNAKIDQLFGNQGGH